MNGEFLRIHKDLGNGEEIGGDDVAYLGQYYQEKEKEIAQLRGDIEKIYDIINDKTIDSDETIAKISELVSNN